MMRKIFTLKSAAALLCLTATTAVQAQIRAPQQITPDLKVWKAEAMTATDNLVPLKAENMVFAGSDGVARAASRTEESDFQFGIVPEGGYAVVYKCLSNAEEVTIPDVITYEGKTYPVQRVYKQSFAARTKLKTVNFGKNIKVIETGAFLACNALTTLNLNEGLLEIQETAFQMFLKNIKSLTLPSTVETIGERAFAGCALTGEFIINKSLKNIGAGAFAGNKITGFYINENGNDWFSSKEGVLYTKDGQSLVVFPPALVEATLTIPEGTVKLAPYALSNCSAVTKVILPESLNEIGDFAFRSCNLSEFNVGKNITHIGQGVFQANKNLKSITLDPANTSFTLTDGMLVDKAAKSLIAVRYDITDINVPAGVETIAPYLCYDNQNVTSFAAPVSTKVIGDNAFYKCQSLTTPQFPGIVSIGHSAFSNTAKIETLIFPSTLRTLGDYSFCASAALKEVKLPEGVDSIGGASFQNCKKLEKANIPSTAKKMGDVMFYGCSMLGELTLSEGITYLPANMAYGCEKLYFCTIPSTVKTIGAGAFSFSWLQEVHLPDGLQKVGNAAFQLCPLKSIEIPNSVVEIDDFGFSLTNATSITCGTGLKRLGNFAFQGNKKAATISLNEGLQEIGFKALYSEQLISHIVIPSTVTTLGDSALIMTPLKVLENRALTPQKVATSIVGMPIKLDWNPTPHELYDSCELSVAKESINAYSTANVWKQFKKIKAFNAVENVDNDDAEIVEIYSIEGYRRDRLMPGINICRYSNGKTRKVISK